MKPIALVVIILISLNSFSQNKTIRAGEKLVYNASYNVFGLLTDIAQVKMETSEVKANKSILLRLKCTVTTYEKWDDFFRIRDLYESYVNPKTLTPYLYKRDVNEGGVYKFMQYKYNHKSKLVKSLKRTKNKKGETLDENKSVRVSSATKDLVSTLYSIRNMDLDIFSPGDEENLPIIYDNIETTLTVKYHKKETVSTEIGNTECHKLALSIKGSDILKDNNDNFLWLTADAKKIPVYAKIKTSLGNGEFKIVSATEQ
ncbi:DUF3108 domain-containing protein [Winogradskyella sp. PG-2]|uniref:DUF3108 domain-containing protein n=1 Tax=Winogradskyella sp. PG-2 TaxID=754409 RepID=UPI0004585F87|nr:DUF3108 domain-containing protein [Winogradskyella sp. PG-2]BAO76960.1 ATP-dependent exoDNAse (exonuclease V) alpha subunit - helicase superfamily I member [Winogradskyella sp. PG-2]